MTAFDARTAAGRRATLIEALHRLAPRLPAFEAGVVVDHALDSRGLLVARPEEAVWLALVSYARHACTDYDAMLTDGYDQESARFFVRETLNDVLSLWGSCRQVEGDA